MDSDGRQQTLARQYYKPRYSKREGGRKLREDGTAFVSQVALDDGGGVDWPVYRRQTLRDNSAATARATKAPGAIDYQVISLVYRQKDQGILVSTARALNIANLVATC